MNRVDPAATSTSWLDICRFDGPCSGDALDRPRAARDRAICRLIKHRALLRTVEAAARLAQAQRAQG